jgi:hypothetical protein
MKKKLAAAASVAAVIASVAFSGGKTTPTFTMINPVYVHQGQSQTVAITGSGFSKNTNLIVDGVAYGLSVKSPTSASFTFTPTMTQGVGFKAVQVKTANLASQTLYFQVCAPLVITTDSIPMTVGVPIGPEGQGADQRRVYLAVKDLREVVQEALVRRAAANRVQGADAAARTGCITDPGHVCNKECPCDKKKKVIKRKRRR